MRLAEHHKEGAFVVDESLQRVLLSATEQGGWGRKRNWLKSKGYLHIRTVLFSGTEIHRYI